MSLWSYMRGILVAEDRVGDAVLGGPADQTMSQSLGLAELQGKWWAGVASPILSVIMNERHHAVRALYGDDGKPLFPERMPAGSPASNPYPSFQRVW